MACGTCYDFTGKVAFVSGAASGIGRATALAFADARAWVAVVDIDEDGGHQTVHMIQQAGGEAIFFRCDVGDPSSIRTCFDQVIRQMGRIDCAFNNAGIEGLTMNTVECTEENFAQVLNINLRGVWLSMKYQIPIMIKNGGGTIVNCSSIAGLVGFEGSPAYVASKHGVIGLTKTAALEFAKQNVRVNAVCPGVIQTPMVDRAVRGNDILIQQLMNAEPVGRMGKPEEIATAVLWLCSEQSSFVTGHPLPVDGGWLAR